MGLFRDQSRKYKYHVEQVSPSHVEGWVYHTARTAPCRVEIKTTDLVTIAEGVAEIPRPDMKGRKCGFRFPLRDDILDLLPARLLLFADGVKVANCHVVLPFDKEQLEDHLKRVMQEKVDAMKLRNAKLQEEMELRTEEMQHEMESRTAKMQQQLELRADALASVRTERLEAEIAELNRKLIALEAQATASRQP